MEQEHLLDQITSEEIKKPKRPVVITVICIIYFFLVAILTPTLIINFKGNFDWSLLVVIAYMAITITFIFAIWKMRKWGAYGFIGLTIFSQIGIILMHNWSLRAFLIPSICSIILLFQLKKMD